MQSFIYLSKMKEFNIDLESNMMPWIGRTSKLIDYYVADCLDKQGIKLTKVQMMLLKRLRENNGLTQHELAFLTNRDKASLARLLNTMEKKNLVARIPSELDHRINLIYITKHGENILKQAWPIIKDVFKQIHQGINNDEISLFINIMQRVQHNIDAEDLFELKQKLNLNGNSQLTK